MKYVVKFAKAIPWALLGRFGVKAILLLGTALIALVVLCGKAVALYLKLHSTDKPIEDEDEDLFDIGSYPSRPDLAPFRPK